MLLEGRPAGGDGAPTHCESSKARRRALPLLVHHHRLVSGNIGGITPGERLFLGVFKAAFAEVKFKGRQNVVLGEITCGWSAAIR